MNDHLTKDAPQEILFQPDDPWIPTEKDTKPYILENLDNIKLSRSQYIATSIINKDILTPKHNQILTDRYRDTQTQSS